MYKNSRLYAVISYITWIGWLVSYIKREKDDTLVLRHLNQALVLNLASTCASLLTRIGGFMGTIGGILSIAALVLAIMGIYRAYNCNEEPLPFVGEIELLK